MDIILSAYYANERTAHTKEKNIPMSVHLFSSIVIEPGVIFVELGGCKLQLNSNLKSYQKAVVKAIQGINKALQLCKDKTMRTPWDNMSQTDRQTDSECVHTHKIQDWLVFHLPRTLYKNGVHT